jgi:hypothetical protein
VLADGTGGMGDIITNTTGAVSLALKIEAPKEIDVAYFKVYVNCDQILNIAATSPDAAVKYDGTVQVPVNRDSHIVVLGFGKKDMPRGLPNYNPVNVPRFTTNAIYIDADGDSKFTAPGGKVCVYDLKGP